MGRTFKGGQRTVYRMGARGISQDIGMGIGVSTSTDASAAAGLPRGAGLKTWAMELNPLRPQNKLATGTLRQQR
eukprot:1996634-Lingulodinium_polyedra.AAC.1